MVAIMVENESELWKLWKYTNDIYPAIQLYDKLLSEKELEEIQHNTMVGVVCHDV